MGRNPYPTALVRAVLETQTDVKTYILGIAQTEGATETQSDSLALVEGPARK